MRNDLTSIAGRAVIVTDRLGDITEHTSGGLFVADTRFLSHYTLRLNGEAPLELESASVGFGEAQIYATNGELGTIPKQALSLSRARVLGADFRERIEIANHGSEVAELELELSIQVDFADIFEVRGYLAGKIPRRSKGRVQQDRIVYMTRSRLRRRTTRISFSRRPETLTVDRALFKIQLQPNSAWQLEVVVEWETPPLRTGLPVPVDRPRQMWEASLAGWIRNAPTLATDDRTMQRAFERAMQDLALLELPLDTGETILAAGIPWYLAIFGRDAIISSLQTLPVAPHFAVGTLRTLAAYQATDADAFRDAQPGKMPHEVRFGVLAESGAVPHARYYGTVDATPLWLILLAETYKWTGDLELVEALLPAAKRALHWIDAWGDQDGDGFVEYQARSPQGLVNQGWKDSWNSIQFADGRLPVQPIALVEAQGYVFAAKRGMAELFDALGDPQAAAVLRSEARELQERVQAAFWMPSEGCYAMALDRQKRQVDGVGSNQGHLLWSGLPEREFAQRVVERLMRPDSFSGWGVRTLASSMAGYNPVSYHIGSVWPHDTALISAGFRRYGFAREANALASGILASSDWFDEQRLPELFCGWDRNATPFPVRYPVACSPQAWSAGAVVMLVSELAGIEPAGDRLHVDPIVMGQHLRLAGVPFRGRRFDIEVSLDGSGSVTEREPG